MDKLVWNMIGKELERQRLHVELIASENFASEEVIKVAGTVLTNKYAEGYPHKRYYGGCENVDVIEQIAIDRAKELFGAEHANVQSHSGSSANAAAYMAVLKPNDVVLGMDLSAGGHLTHGHKMNFSARTYKFVSYELNREELIDYDQVERLALEHKPKLIVAGASAYSRFIDWERFKKIADKVGAYFMVDMAHIAGLVGAGEHPSPIPYADIVTTTNHKTLRGPRGGMILCTKELAKAIDLAVFPGQQGGPLEHIIAAKAIALGEALTPEWKQYQKQVVLNAKAFAAALNKEGFRLISKGTDNHLMMIDVKNTIGITGKEAEKILHSVYITANKNSIPFDTESPFRTSGLRFGTPAMTTRGFKESEFEEVAKVIGLALKNKDSESVLNECRERISALTSRFPLYPNLKY